MKNRLFGVLRRARSVCAPKNAGKRIFAAFLSVCVAVSSFVVPVHAVPAVIPFLGKLALDFFIGYAAGVSARSILDSNSNLEDMERQQILSSVSEAASENLVEFVANDDQKTIYVQPVSGLSGDQLEMAEFISDFIQSDLNKSAGAGNSWSNFIYNSITNNTTLPDSPSDSALETSAYSFLKTSAYNAMNGYVAKKAYEGIFEENNLTASAIESALGESFPRYHFDITDPSKSRLSFTSPESGNISSLRKDGFIFTPAASFTPGQTAFTRSQTEYIVSFVSGYVNSAGDYIRLNPDHDPLYAFNYYFLTDDGNLYFSTYLSYGSNGITGGNSYPLNTSSFYDISGKMITGKEANAIKSRITSVGAVLNTGNQIANSIPVDVKSTLTDDDFWSETGGEVISSLLPFTGAEKILGGAISAGLLAADPLLTIGADGSIIAADGIPVDKLGEILEAITSGNLNLESIEDYLSLISTLVGNGNLTMTEQQKILENIGAYAGAFAGDISAIKDILKEWAKAAEAEAAAENLDYDLPDVTIIDKFPFSLPFDVYYVLDLLCTEPKKPIFTIPIKTTIKIGNFRQQIDEKIVLDLTTFKVGGVDMVRAVINTTVTIAFVFSLIAATRKFIWK